MGKRNLKKIAFYLAAIVLLSYLLMHPAITLERKAICGKEEHTHTEECYEKELSCTEEHEHTEDCYEEVQRCEKEEHTHTGKCFPEIEKEAEDAEEPKQEETDAEESNPEKTDESKTDPAETSAGESSPKEAEIQDTNLESADTADTKTESADTADTNPEGTDGEESNPEVTDATEIIPEEVEAEQTDPEDQERRVTIKEARAYAALSTRNSIMDGRKIDTANAWQIVEGQYQGNSPTCKPNKNDDVRVQKNVIPTDTENEFLVYLSVDTSESTQSYFKYADYEVTTSNNYHDPALEGKVVGKMTGNQKVGISSNPSSGYPNSGIFTIYDADGKTVLANNITLYWEQAQNITIYVTLHLENGDTKYLILCASVKEGTGKHYKIILSDTAKTYVENLAAAVSLNRVVDQMGEHVIYDGTVICDGSTSYDADVGKLIWNPAVKNTEQTTEKETVDGVTTTIRWNLNTAELLYKVHLDVTDEGFESGKSYAVNQKATLSYGENNETMDFPVPKIKGTLYGFSFQKVDEETGELLSGAEFEITVTNQDLSGGIVRTAKDQGDGTYSFSHLPWGDAVLVEKTAPDGYEKTEEQWEFTLGYTEDLKDHDRDGRLTSHSDVGDTVPKVFPGIWIGNQVANEDGSSVIWTIPNKRKKIEISIYKQDVSGNSLGGAVFDLYTAEEYEKLMDGDEETQAEKSGTFTSDEETGLLTDQLTLKTLSTYYLVERKAPFGYVLLEDPVEIAVSGDGRMTSTSAGVKVDNEKLRICIVNNPGIKLPDTGGTGTFCYTSGGLLLICMAALMYIFKKKGKKA